MAARTWISDSTKNWSDVTAWDGGTTVPATTDSVTFNSTHVGSCTADAFGTWSGGTLTISSGYTGTITKSAGVAMTTAAWSQAAGTFTYTTGNLTTGASSFTLSGGAFNQNGTGTFITGAFSCTGGTFTRGSGSGTFTSTTFGCTSAGVFSASGGGTMSTNAVTFSGTANIAAPGNGWTLAGSWTQSGSTTTFTANAGTITITAASTFNDARSTFNKIIITTTAAAVTISANTTAPLGATPTTTVTTSTLTINGTVTWSGTWTHTGNITTGSGSVLTGTSTPKITMQAAGGGASNLTIGASTTITNPIGTITFSGANGDSTLTDTSDLLSGTTYTISKTGGTNFTVAASTTCRLGASPTTTTTTATFTINGTATFTGTWGHTGSITVSSTGTISGGGSTITLTTGSWSANSASVIPASLNITFIVNGSGSLTFVGGGLTYGTFRITGTTGVTVTISGANTFGKIQCDDRKVQFSIVFPASTTTTINSWSVSGISGQTTTIISSSAGTAATLTNGSGLPFETDWLTITDIVVDVAPQWFAGWNSVTTAASVDANWKKKAMTLEAIYSSIREGTAQAGANGSITLDANASAVDNFYKYDFIVIVAGTGVGQSSKITGYTGSTKVATVSPVWATNPDSTSIFGIIPSGDIDTYQMKVTIDRDNSNTTDRYMVAFYKNGQPVITGITSPTIEIVKQTDGTDLVASQSLTQVASLGLYKYTEGTNRITLGAAYYAIVTATIDGSSRTWNQPISRDS